MKETLTKIKKNNNKVQFLSYDNWGRRVARLLIAFVIFLILGLIALSLSISSLFYLKKNTINPAYWLLMSSLVILLLSLLVEKYIVREFKKLWFNFYEEVVLDRDEKDVEELTKKAFDNYVNHILLTEDAALPMFGYISNENGTPIQLSYANLTYIPTEYIPVISCAFLIIESDTGTILEQGSTTDLNRSMENISFSTQINNTLAIIATQATDIRQYQEICELFNIPFI